MMKKRVFCVLVKSTGQSRWLPLIGHVFFSLPCRIRTACSETIKHSRKIQVLEESAQKLSKNPDEVC